MKAMFIAFNQAYNEEIVDLLQKRGQRGYTKWEDIAGRGTFYGEPHLGNHAWPTQNHAIFAAVPDEVVPVIMADLRMTDEAHPDLGLRAYVLNIEQSY